MSTPSPKHDTVFQSDDGGTPDDWTALIVDDGQHGEDLTSGTTYGYLTGGGAGRYTVAGGFCVVARVTLHTTTTRMILNFRDGTVDEFTFRMATGSVLRLRINDTTILDVNIPSLPTSPTTHTCVVSVCGTPNPLTTGATDAFWYEMRCWNESNSNEVSGNSIAGPAIDISGSPDVVWGAQTTAGANEFTGEIIDLYYGARFHSSIEILRDWITAASAPTLTADAPIEIPVPDTSSGFASSDECVGPALSLAAASLHNNSLLTASPVVNMIPVVQTFQQGTQPDTTRWASDNVQDTDVTWYWVGAYAWYPPVGLNYNKLKCHVHLQAYDSGVSGPYTTRVRVYSMSAHPDSLDLAIPGESPAEELTYYYDTQSSSTDHGSGATGGEWLTFSSFPIARAPGEEHTFIGVAVRIVTGSGTPSEHRWRLRAVHVEPVAEEADNPGVGDGLHFG